MGKYLLLLSLFLVLVTVPSTGQKIASGIRYQALLLDASGNPEILKVCTLHISLLADQSNPKVYYTEKHKVKTDAFGYLTVVIGTGEIIEGAFASIPWSEKQIWMKCAVAQGLDQFRPLSDTKFMKSPLAFYAQTADYLQQDTSSVIEKSQSIYWSTSGNSGSSPQLHFLGTVEPTDLVLRTVGTPGITLTKDGQMQITGGIDGESDNLNAYPLLVQGGNQGIYIKINGSRSGDNNFMAFADGENTWGAIQGQTQDELEADWEYKLKKDLFNLQIASFSVSSAGSIVQSIFLLAAPCPAGGAALTEAAFISVQLGNLLSDKLVYERNKLAELGVSYETGAGDYAEWLERAEGVHNLDPGEVVGVKGGKISLRTTDADHLMVISTKPAVLGNMPRNTEDPATFEKVAFMGQVPVRVLGSAMPGDYVIPSGNNDGFAIAIHPDSMKTGDFKNIIGVSWDSSASDRLISYINVAVGIHANTLTKKVEELEREVQLVLDQLKGQKQLPKNDKEPDVQPFSKLTKTLSDERFDEFVECQSDLLTQVFSRAKAEATSYDVDINKNALLKEFFDQPVDFIKKIRRDPQLESQWAIFDAKIVTLTDFFNN